MTEDERPAPPPEPEIEPPQTGRSGISADIVAGLVAAIPSIPDAMASGLLAGVNPIYGLYGLMIGTPVASLFTGSAFMSVVTTSAMAIALAEPLAGYSGMEQIQALVTLSLVIGVVQLAAGLLKLGFLVRFVSNSVMTGFLTGIALLIILGQLGDLLGYSYIIESSNKVLQTFDLLTHLGQISVATTLIGLASIVVIVFLGRTKLSNFAMLIALVLAGLAVLVFQPEGVRLVGDTGEIPAGFPLPNLPIPLLDPQLIFAGVAIALIGLVQGAGISSSYPNPDGRYPDVSRDFVGQGVANLAVSAFRGLPVGGSISSTALIVSAGAKSRWGNLFLGVFAIIAVLLFGQQIERLPLTALAAMLVVAGFQSLNFGRIEAVWQTSTVSRLVMVTTFLATLAFPIQWAVLIGIVLHLGLHTFRSADRLEIVQYSYADGGKIRESAPPAELPPHEVTVLQPVGSLFFAAATDFGEELPRAEGVAGAVVIVILRGRDELGSTFIQTIDRYSQTLRAGGGKLVLAGVSEPVYTQLERTHMVERLGAENIYRETGFLGESAKSAYDDATEWLAQQPAA
jgi:SulP family sulfate permease